MEQVVTKSSPPETTDKLITMGSLGKSHGVRGWMRLNSFTDPIDNLLDYQPWMFLVQKKWQSVEVEGVKPHGKGYIVKLAGIDTPEEAKLYAGVEIGISRDCLPQLDDNQHYWVDLEGLEVKTVQGKILGSVSHLFATGSNDVIVVQGDKEYYIPYIAETVVKQVDTAAGTLTVDWDVDF